MSSVDSVSSFDLIFGAFAPLISSLCYHIIFLRRSRSFESSPGKMLGSEGHASWLVEEAQSIKSCIKLVAASSFFCPRKQLITSLLHELQAQSSDVRAMLVLASPGEGKSSLLKSFIELAGKGELAGVSVAASHFFTFKDSR